jgi:molybdate transport system substrate-binding protein
MFHEIRSRILLSGIIALSLSANIFAAAPKTEIIVSAAASLTDTMNELIEMYKKVKPDVTVTPTYGSSGSLQQQIEQGAPVDIFLSASPKQMNALSKQGLILEDTRKNVVENKVVLIVPKSSKGITRFEDAATDKIKQIALGEPSSVPVGQYSEEVFTSLGILDKVKAKAIYAKDVRQVLTYVEMGEVDAGVVYATDAAISKKVTVIATAPEGTHKPVIYPAALVKTSAQPQVAKAFLAWLSSPEASKIFVKYGFAVVK